MFEEGNPKRFFVLIIPPSIRRQRFGGGGLVKFEFCSCLVEIYDVR
jgi:hypothetical protein